MVVVDDVDVLVDEDVVDVVVVGSSDVVDGSGSVDDCGGSIQVVDGTDPTLVSKSY